MKNIKVYEFHELLEDDREKIFAKNVEDIVENELNFLSEELNRGEITEEKFYEMLNCSKSYAESTVWFVPCCYYEKHKKEVDKQAKEMAERGLYTAKGKYIQEKE